MSDYYKNAIASLEDGSLLDSTEETLSGTRNRALADMGVSDPLKTGFVDEVKKGAISDFNSTLGSIYSTLGTLGNEESEIRYRQYLGKEQAKQNLKPAEGLANKAAWLVGNGASQFAGFMAATAIGGGAASGVAKALGATKKVAGMAYSFGRTAGMFANVSAKGHGENVRYFRDRGLEEGDAQALALMQDIVTTSIEQLLGAERIVGNKIKSKTLARMFKNVSQGDPAFKGQLDTIGRAILWPKPGFTRGFATAVGEESIEEGLEYLSRRLTDKVVFGESDFDIRELATVMISAIPSSLAGGIFGGAANMSINQKQFNEDATQDVTADTRQAAFTIDGSSENAIALEEEFNTAMNGLTISLRQGMDEESTQALTTLMEKVSMNMASLDDKRSPADYINTFQQVFIKGDVDMSAIAGLIKEDDSAGVVKYLRDNVEDFDAQVYEAQKTGQIETIQQINSNQYNNNKENDISGLYDTEENMSETISGALNKYDINENTVVPPHITATMPRKVFDLMATVGKINVTTKSGETLQMTMFDDGSLGFSQPLVTVDGDDQNAQLSREAIRRLALMDHSQRMDQEAINDMHERARRMRMQVLEEVNKIGRPELADQLETLFEEEADRDTRFIVSESGLITDTSTFLKAIQMEKDGPIELRRMTEKELQDMDAAIDKQQAEAQALKQGQIELINSLKARIAQEIQAREAQEQEARVEADERILEERRKVKRPPKQVRGQITERFPNMAQQKLQRRAVTIDEIQGLGESLGAKVVLEKDTQARVEQELQDAKLATIRKLDGERVQAEDIETEQELGVFELPSNLTDDAIQRQVDELESKKAEADENQQTLSDDKRVQLLQVDETDDIRIVKRAYDILIAEGLIERPTTTVSKSEMIDVIAKHDGVVSDETQAELDKAEKMAFAIDARLNILRLEQENRQAIEQAKSRGKRASTKNIQLSAGDKIYGSYLKQYNLAVYYQGATGEQVLHEWLHHLMEQGLIEMEQLDVIKSAYDTSGEWNPQDREAAVDALSLFIRDGEIEGRVNDKVLKAFNTVRGVMNESFHAERASLNEEAQAQFLQWFRDLGVAELTPSAQSVLQATEMARGVATNELQEESPREASIFLSVDNSDKGREQSRHQIYKNRLATPEELDRLAEELELEHRSEIPVSELQLLADARGAQKMEMRKLAKEAFSIEQQEGNNNDLVMSKLKEMNDSAKNYGKKKTKSLSVKQDSDAVNKYLLSKPKALSQRANAVGGNNALAISQNRMNRILTSAKNWRDSVFGGVIIDLSDFRTFITELTDGQTNNPIYKLYKKFQDMQRKHQESIQETNRWFTKRLQALPKNFIGELRQIHDIAGKQFTGEELLAYYLFTRGDLKGDSATALFTSNLDISIDKNGEVSRKQFDIVMREAQKVVNKSKGLKALIALSDNYFKYIKPRIDKEHKKIYNRGTGEIKNYFPMIRDGGLYVDTDWLGNVAGITLAKTDKKMAFDPRFKTRQKGAEGGKIRTDVLNVFDDYRLMADNYIAKATDVEHMRAVLNESAGTFKAVGYDKEQTALRTLVEREMYPTGRMTPMTNFEMLVRAIRTNSQWATLVGNVPSVIRQGVSYWNGMGEVPGLQPLKGAGIYSKALTYVATMRSKKAGGGHPLAGFHYYELMKKHNSPHRNAKHDPEVVDSILSNRKGIRGRKIKAFGNMSITEAGLYPQHIADAVTRVSVWGAAFDYKLSQLKLEAMYTPQQAEQEAASFADSTVNKTQPPATISERALWQTGNEYQRALTMYTGQLFKNFSYMRNDIYAPMAQAFKEGKTWDAKVRNVFDVFFRNAPEGSATTVGRKTFFSLIMPPMMLGMIFRGRPPEDMEEFMKDFIAYNIGAVPIIGTAISAMMLYDSHKTSSSPVYAQLLDSITTATKNITETIQGVEGAKEDLASDALYASQFVGFPREVIRQFVTVPYVKDYYEEHGIDAETLMKAMFRYTDKDDTLIDKTFDIFQ